MDQDIFYQFPKIQFLTHFPDLNIELWIMREDQNHPEISGNKLRKLYGHLEKIKRLSTSNKPRLITFGGAYSNHIAAGAAAAEILGCASLGIIRGEELANNTAQSKTLRLAQNKGMDFLFVSREAYRNKDELQRRVSSFIPDAYWIPEGGTSLECLEGFNFLKALDLTNFTHLCSASATGGSLAGYSQLLNKNQKYIGYQVVTNNLILSTIKELNPVNFDQIEVRDARWGGYAKKHMAIEKIINIFDKDYSIPLEPVYTAKMFASLLQDIEEGRYKNGSKILAIHTGGLQGR